MKGIKKYLVTVPMLYFILAGCAAKTKNISQEKQSQPAAAAVEADKLAVLWTSGDPEVAHRVCFMYTHAAKRSGWFKQVQLIVWGPSSKLLSEDKSLQDEVKAMMADGIEVKACKACADSYGVADKLAALGIDVRYMGVPLTNILKASDWKLLTF
jgi:hypothetical protein